MHWGILSATSPIRTLWHFPVHPFVFPFFSPSVWSCQWSKSPWKGFLMAHTHHRLDVLCSSVIIESFTLEKTSKIVKSNLCLTIPLVNLSTAHPVLGVPSSCFLNTSGMVTPPFPWVAHFNAWQHFQWRNSSRCPGSGCSVLFKLHHHSQGQSSISCHPSKQHRGRKKLLLPYFHEQSCLNCNLLFVTCWPCVCKLHNEQNTPRDKWAICIEKPNSTLFLTGFVPAQLPFGLLWCNTCVHTHPHPFPHTRSCKRASVQPLGLWFIFNCKEGYKGKHKAEFLWVLLCSRIALWYLLYGSLSCVLYSWGTLWALHSEVLQNPQEQQNTGIKSDFQERSQVKQQNVQPRAYWDDRSRPVSSIFSHLGRATGTWGLYYPHFQRHWNYEPHL